MKRYYLSTQYDSAKSFYNKAEVRVEGNTLTLYSYETKIATIKNGSVILTSDWDYSRTTIRHLKEFLKQNGFKADTTKQLKADYE